MPTPRSEVPAVEVAGMIVVAGGLDTSGPAQTAFDTVDIYNPSSNDWTTGPPMPEARHHLQAAAHGGALYVFGGVNAGWVPQDNVWRLDLAKGRWETLDPMPEPVAAGAAVTIDDLIFVIAGVGTERAVLVLDPVTGRWGRRSPLPQRREHLAAAVVGRHIYVVGGRWPGEGETTRVDRYDPLTDVWSQVAPLIAARAGHAVTVAGPGLLAAGGEVLGQGIALSSTEQFDPSADLWQPGPPLPRPTHGLAAVTVGGQVYLVGGAPEAGRADATGDLLRLRAAPPP